MARDASPPRLARFAEELAAELRADYQAARIRDYGEDDAATYEQRVREGASLLPSPSEIVDAPPRPSPQADHDQELGHAMGHER